MSRASTDALDALHALMANSMTEELGRDLDRARQPKVIPDPCDETKTIANPDYAPLSAKLLGVIRAFLKDNGIDAPSSSPRFNSLVDKLKDLKVDELGAA